MPKYNPGPVGTIVTNLPVNHAAYLSIDGMEADNTGFAGFGLMQRYSVRLPPTVLAMQALRRLTMPAWLLWVSPRPMTRRPWRLSSTTLPARLSTPAKRPMSAFTVSGLTVNETAIVTFTDAAHDRLTSMSGTNGTSWPPDDA